eukprot:11988474-Ditylum_brightwellii.AAC.3
MVALLEVWPEAVKNKDRHGSTPLHVACYKGASPDVVAHLLKSWPETIKEKDRCDYTPLHVACHASCEVTPLLLNAWLSYRENRTKIPIMSLQKNKFNFTGDVKVLFSHLFALCNSDTENPSPNEIMDYFVHVEMWNGATLVLDRKPTVIKTMGLDTKVMADLLSTVGRCCSLTTMWEVIRNEQDLLEGV